MPKYRVVHGTVSVGEGADKTKTSKAFSGDKAQPGKGELVELDEKTAAPLVRKGVLAPAAAEHKAPHDPKPPAK